MRKCIVRLGSKVSAIFQDVIEKRLFLVIGGRGLHDFLPGGAKFLVGFWRVGFRSWEVLDAMIRQTLRIAEMKHALL